MMSTAAAGGIFARQPVDRRRRDGCPAFAAARIARGVFGGTFCRCQCIPVVRSS